MISGRGRKWVDPFIVWEDQLTRQNRHKDGLDRCRGTPFVGQLAVSMLMTYAKCCRSSSCGWRAPGFCTDPNAVFTKNGRNDEQFRCSPLYPPMSNRVKATEDLIHTPSAGLHANLISRYCFGTVNYTAMLTHWAWTSGAFVL